MTLIAAFSIEGVPVLVGDFLLTDNATANPHMFLPTHPELSAQSPKLLGARIAGLSKKIHVVNDRFAVGFTGRVDDGARILRTLVAEFSLAAPSLLALEKALSPFNHKTKGFAQVIGWTASSRPVCFEWKSNDTNAPLLVNSVFAGSGGVPFRNSLTEAATSEISPNIKTAVEKAQFVGISEVGGVLATELMGLDNLKAFYGYGAELIFWTGVKFSYVPKICFCFWNAGINRDGTFFLNSSNVMALYQSFGEFSALQVAHIGPSPNGESKLVANNTYVTAITPLHDKMPELDPRTIGRIPVASDFYFNAIAAKDERSGKTGVFKVVSINDNNGFFEHRRVNGIEHFQWKKSVVEGAVRAILG